ncbi:MAG: conjugal transfer protein TraX [Oscillospiraceae bacterium]|nr:conjugal transfer protein TraX [Oscillospiraceae bacterium]
MTSRSLRLLAVLSMLVDHVGYALAGTGAVPEYVTTAMRLVGRLAMPIYCFLIAEGFFHTKHVGKYAGRLLMFAILSEIPFDLFCSGGRMYVNMGSQNVLFTLFLGLLAIWLCDRFALRGWYPLSLLGVLACAAVAQLAQTDYGMYGVLLIFVCYCFRDRPSLRGLCIVGVCVLMGAARLLESPNTTWPLVISCGAVAAVPIWLYNGRRGKGGRVMQIAFYAFYPLHLLLITATLPIPLWQR